MSHLTNPRALVICGPSGCGKSTLLQKVLTEFPNSFGFSVSHTTRKPRPGEVDGMHYHFTDIETMKKAIEEGKFIETAQFSGNIYGTSHESVEKVAKEGKVCILDIEMEGVKQVKKSGLDPWCVFIEPPSIDHLRERLKGRRTETEESLALRLKKAEVELEFGKTPGVFHKVIVNDNLEHAYSQLREFLVESVLAKNDNK